MHIYFDPQGTIEGFNAGLEGMVFDPSVQSILVLSCDENNLDLIEFDRLLQSCEKTIFGGIFPQIVYDRKNYQQGTVLVGLEEEINVYEIPNLSSEDSYEAELDSKIGEIEGINTMLVFVDGLSKRISALVEGLFNVFGLDFNFLGGGAGSLSFLQKPCIISNNGLLVDSAIVCATTRETQIGVKHGWEYINGPFRVTQSERNIIHTLDHRPAFEIYQEVIAEHSGLRFKGDNFFEIAKSYPFGIKKANSEVLVRDPLMLAEDDTSLICVGEVPENSYVDILNGSKNRLIEAAKDAGLELKTRYPSPPQELFLIDCISRVLFLEDRFHEELEAVSDERDTLFGALTLGEIANSGSDYLEFYNKTTVVASI